MTAALIFPKNTNDQCHSKDPCLFEAAWTLTLFLEDLKQAQICSAKLVQRVFYPTHSRKWFNFIKHFACSEEAETYTCTERGMNLFFSWCFQIKGWFIASRWYEVHWNRDTSKYCRRLQYILSASDFGSLACVVYFTLFFLGEIWLADVRSVPVI